MKPLRNPFGGDDIPSPELLDDPNNAFLGLIDSLIGSQPGSMNDVFRELRERGFRTEETDDE